LKKERGDRRNETEEKLRKNAGQVVKEVGSTAGLGERYAWGDGRLGKRRKVKNDQLVTCGTKRHKGTKRDKT